MEQDNISLQYGMYRTPSLGNDGELSECVNLIPKAGELVNLQEPKMMSLSGASTDYMENLVLLNAHKYGDLQIYITYKTDNGRVYYSLSDGAFSIPGTTFGTSDQIGDSFVYGTAPLVTCFGNIVILTSDNDNRYFIFKNNAFSYLGDSIPSLYLNFGIRLSHGDNISQFSGNEDLYINTENNGSGWTTNYGVVFGQDGYPTGVSDRGIPTTVQGTTSGYNPQTVATEAVLGAVNKYLNEYCYKEGYFAEPFLVRYAYRLYDGNLIMASAPVLMVPSVRPVPEVTVSQALGSKIYFRVRGNRCSLDYAQLNDFDVSAWKDIIKSVDIFVSAPLRQYNQAGTIERAEMPSFGEVRGYYRHNVNRGSGSENISLYAEDVFMNSGIVVYSLPKFSDDVFNERVRDCSNFYHIKSIPFTDFDRQASTERFVISIEEGLLQGLTAREALSDNGASATTIVPKGVWEFNGRLNMYNYKKYLPNKYPAQVLFPYINAVTFDEQYEPIQTASPSCNVLSKTTLDIDGQVFKVATYLTYSQYFNGSFYIFYPNSGATTMRVAYSTEDDQDPLPPNTPKYYYKDYDLARHNMLDAAVYFNGFGSYIGQNPTEVELQPTEEFPNVELDDATQDSSLYVQEKNRIITTAESNPFLFNISNVVTMSGEVLSLSAPYKALSQGQFGQFVIAFCSDGIWSLGVNDVGLFAAKTPVSRDVCTNPESITQIDSAVVFVTNQGLKLISGSEVVLLSEAIEGLNVNESSQPDISDAVLAFAKKIDPDEYSQINPYVPDNSQFVEQVQTAKMVYDYPHNLLHVFHDFTNKSTAPYTNRHYVYSFDTKQWSSQVLFNNYLKAYVPGYPLTTMQFGNALYQYDKITDNNNHIGYALTRPLSLGDPLTRKALYDLRVFGQRTQANTVRRVAVYVSNDNVNWYQLKSLKAMSAKYYRFLVMTYQCDIDTVSGLALQYDYRYNHKMRSTEK